MTFFQTNENTKSPSNLYEFKEYFPFPSSPLLRPEVKKPTNVHQAGQHMPDRMALEEGVRPGEAVGDVQVPNPEHQKWN